MTDFDYNKLAHNSLNKFVATVYKAINDNEYDLILAGGDSGNIMAWITEVIYQELRLAVPKKITLPTYRHSDEAETIIFDNRILKSQINKSVIDKKLTNVLFVDDEVGEGNTIRGFLSALAEVTTDRPVVTFIAENEDFEPQSVPGWKIDFRIPQPKVDKVWNAISYILPYVDFVIPTKNVLEPVMSELNDKQVMTTLLNLPLKEWDNGHPRFTWKYINLCNKKISNFKDLQAGVQKYMREQISEQIDVVKM